MALTQYKIVLVGDGAVGKTTWVKKLLTNKFETKYIATLGVEVHPIHVQTNRGPMVFNIWDCAGQIKYGGLNTGQSPALTMGVIMGVNMGYYENSDGAIVMYDSTKQSTQENVSKYGTKLNSVNLSRNNGLPIVTVATKCDDGFYPSHGIGISSKYDLDVRGPLLQLVREITKNESIEFI
jgi:GTP-binding nuclear protein Ran